MRRARPLWIRGWTGTNAGSVNGIWEPTKERRRDRVVYRMRGDGDLRWLSMIALPRITKARGGVTPLVKMSVLQGVTSWGLCFTWGYQQTRCFYKGPSTGRLLLQRAKPPTAVISWCCARPVFPRVWRANVSWHYMGSIAGTLIFRAVKQQNCAITKQHQELGVQRAPITTAPRDMQHHTEVAEHGKFPVGSAAYSCVT